MMTKANTGLQYFSLSVSAQIFTSASAVTNFCLQKEQDKNMFSLPFSLACLAGACPKEEDIKFCWQSGSLYFFSEVGWTS